MKFTVERQSLVNMIGLLAIKPAHRKQSDSWMRLTASGSRVFVEGNETTCGVEALVMSEGTCRVRRSVLLRILQSYHPRVNITMEGRPGALQLVNSTIAISGFNPVAVAPENFRSFVVTTDRWLAGSISTDPPSLDDSSPMSQSSDGATLRTRGP